MNARRCLAASLALWLGGAALGCGRYGPPRRSGSTPPAGAPANPTTIDPDSDDEQRRSRRAPRR